MVWSVSWIRGSHQQYPKGLIVFPDVVKKRSNKIFSDAFRLSADLLDILCGLGKNLILCFGQHFPRFGIVCVNGGTVQRLQVGMRSSNDFIPLTYLPFAVVAQSGF